VVVGARKNWNPFCVTGRNAGISCTGTTACASIAATSGRWKALCGGRMSKPSEDASGAACSAAKLKAEGIATSDGIAAGICSALDSEPL